MFGNDCLARFQSVDFLIFVPSSDDTGAEEGGFILSRTREKKNNNNNSTSISISVCILSCIYVVYHI